jgi:hypothetical protein
MVPGVAAEAAVGAVASLGGVGYIRTCGATRSAMVHGIVGHTGAQTLMVAAVTADTADVVGAAPDAGGRTVRRIGAFYTNVSAAIRIAVTSAIVALDVVTRVT